MKTLPLKPLIHVFAWSLLALIPMVAGLQSQDPQLHIPMRDIWRVGLLCGIFYLNYLWLIPAHLLKGNRFLFLSVNIGFAILLHVLLHHGSPPPMPPDMIRPHHMRERPLILIGFTSFMLVSLTAGMAVAIRMTEQWFLDQKRKASQETEHLKSELSYLKLQLSPHFLLNTLNNIYSLTAQDTEKAQKAIHHLGKLLRYLLYETEAELVPLQGEIEFLKSYIELMTLRTGHNVRVESYFEESPGTHSIAPLLFLPLVENAFKHGPHPSHECSIRISLQIRDAMICFSTKNSNHPKDAGDRSGSGVGLANLRKRLELIYPGRHQYSARTESEIYHSDLKISVED